METASVGWQDFSRVFSHHCIVHLDTSFQCDLVHGNFRMSTSWRLSVFLDQDPGIFRETVIHSRVLETNRFMCVVITTWILSLWQWTLPEDTVSGTRWPFLCHHKVDTRARNDHLERERNPPCVQCKSTPAYLCLEGKKRPRQSDPGLFTSERLYIYIAFGLLHRLF